MRIIISSLLALLLYIGLNFFFFKKNFNNTSIKNSFASLKQTDSYKKATKDLTIYGPFSYKDKVKASIIYSKILCKETDKVLINKLIKKSNLENNLPNGIEFSFEVLKASNELKKFYKNNECINIEMNKDFQKEIFERSFIFNK
tara:strand:+ start:829 stop:1260 length:432 start_codon:yes stop_codon:yes gene_type:complete